jgi:hypothetical protein
MNQLPPKYAEPMRAFVEGRQPSDAWPRWLAPNARGLARLLARDQMRRLREEPATFLPRLLADCGIPCEPPPFAKEGRSRPDEWALAICEDVSSLQALYQFLSERRWKDLCEDGGVVSLTRVGFGRAGHWASSA